MGAKEKTGHISVACTCTMQFLYPFQFVDILEEAEESEEDTINEMID